MPYVKLTLALSLLTILLGCGGGENSATSTAQNDADGSAEIFLHWQNKPASKAIEEDTYTTQALGGDCRSEGVGYILCDVYGPDGSLVKTAERWDCEAHEGILDEIPAGDGRVFVCRGEDGNGNLSRLGHSAGVTINTNEIADVGDIDFYPFTVSLAAPQDGETVNTGGGSLSWSSVPNAVEYRLQVSQNSGFNTPVVDEIVTQTSWPISDLTSGQTYYWRIAPIDAYSNEGVALEIRSFDLTQGEPMESGVTISGTWQFEGIVTYRGLNHPCDNVSGGMESSIEFFVSGNLVTQAVWGRTFRAWGTDENCNIVEITEGADDIPSSEELSVFNITEPIDHNEAGILCQIFGGSGDSPMTVDELTSNQIVCSETITPSSGYEQLNEVIFSR